MTEKVTYDSLKDVPTSSWKALSEKKIYFGHQSVGYNIISGIEMLLMENHQIKLKIKETYDLSKCETGVLAHSRIGYNNYPESKLKAFEFYMNAGGENSVDISTFKYCYVDFNQKTKVKEVFNEYKITMSALKNIYPKTVFVITTVPLTTIQTGIKAWIKKIIGKPLRGVAENIKRNEFNELLRNEYKEKDPIFDLAEVESKYPDGKRSTFEVDGKTYYSMAADYTFDGGHLNEIGRKKIADAFLLQLANL